MYKLLRIALFAVPLAGGAAWAQGAGTSGSAVAPGRATPPVTDDTRTPLQQKAGRIDDTTPVIPGDATKPAQVPNTVEESNTTGLPDKKVIPDDTTKMDHKLDRDADKDSSGSDK